MTEEEKAVTAQTGDTAATATNGGVPDNAAGALNIQAGLEFKLIGRSLMAAFSRIGGYNTFLIIPTEGAQNDGMSLKDMVAEINEMMKGFSKSSPSLDENQLGATLTDVSEAGKKDSENAPDNAFDPLEIIVFLKQAFLLFKSGGTEPSSIEYALTLNVDFKEIFPSGASFFAVERLFLSFWNTDRVKILADMDLLDIEKYLEEHA